MSVPLEHFDDRIFPFLVIATLGKMPNGPMWAPLVFGRPGLLAVAGPDDDGFLAVTHDGMPLMDIHEDMFDVRVRKGPVRFMVDGRPHVEHTDWSNDTAEPTDG